jgi:hypothetical protein
MLLTHRRWGPLRFCLAGMEMAWFAPIFLFFYQQAREWPPFAVFIGLFGGLLVLILSLELLNRLRIDSPGYELAVLGLVLLSSLLLVRFCLYADMPIGDFRWLHNIFDTLFNFPQRLGPELVLILTNSFLWQRAANATSRDLGFFGVGVNFRLGLLLLILTANLVNFFTDQNATIFLWLYLGLGLTAVSLARTHEKAAGAQSTGTLLPLPRLAQLLLTVGLTVGAIAWLSLFYTPTRIKTALSWLKPLWAVLEPVLWFLLQVLFWLLEPIVAWLALLLRQLFANLHWERIEELLDSLGENSPFEPIAEQNGAIVTLPPWAWTALRYIGTLLAITLVLGLVLLFLDRVRTRPAQDEAEEESGEKITLGGDTLARGMRWLRDMAGLVRRLGLSRQLLAAISVQNIYANLCRLARRRGYPRHPAQPPDDYLPVLAEAFDGQEEILARITAAYMRVHYGDQPVSDAELAQLREDYHHLCRIQAQTGAGGKEI